MSGPKYRTSWWQRRAIRRSAIADARHRMPLPSMQGVVTTPFREALWTVRDRQIVALRAELVELVTEAEVRVGTATRAIAMLEDELATAREAVEAARGEMVDSTLRRLGDENVPDDLVAARRRREHARAISESRKRCDELSQAIAEQQRVRATERACITEACRSKAADAVAAHLAATARCGVYDQALLRRHPERQLLAYCLDMTPHPLPAWVLAYADDPEFADLVALETESENVHDPADA